MPTGYTDFYRGLFITVEALLTSSPVDGQVDKAPTSDWAFDHTADATAHHAAIGGAISGGFPADSYCAILQGSWTYTAMACGVFANAFRNVPANNGDGLHWHARLDPGVYEMSVGLSHWNDCGIVEFKIGAWSVYTIDTYSAGNQFITTNFWFEPGVGIGPVDFYFVINGKNASSAGYRMNFVYWTIRKTA